MNERDRELEAFSKFIGALEPWLREVLLIGGWAHRLYRRHPLARRLAYLPLITLDGDVAVPPKLKARELSVRKRLLDAGFVEEFVGEDWPPATHYHYGKRGGFYAEFLSPPVGSEYDRRGKRKATREVSGISSQLLRYIEILMISPWKVQLGRENGYPFSPKRKVQIANPTSFLAQKILIHEDRVYKDRAKDLLYIHDTIEVFAENIAIGMNQEEGLPKELFRVEHRSACAAGMRIPARADACCGSHRGWHLKLALLLSFCLALASSASSLPQTQSRTEASATVSKARALLQQGNTEQVIDLLSHYLQAHSKDSSARLTLGQAYAMAGRNDRATDEFETVLREAPTNYVALAALGEIYYRANQLERAEPLLARAAKLSQGTPQIRMEWAIVLARSHRYKEAKNALVGVPVPKGAEDGIAYHRLKASIEAGLGGSAEAAVQMEKALALKPDDAGLAMATAAAELQNKNWARAAELAEPVFSRSDDPGAGLVLLEAQLGMSADYHSTLGKLRSASLPPEQEGEFRERLAQVLIDHGKTAEAVQELTKAAELHPDRANVIFNLALARYRAGLLDDAIASAERCKTLGDSAEVEDLLGDIQEARGDNLAAVRSYQAAVSLAPGEEKYRLSLALELIQHKSFDAAKAVLEQAEGLRPESWRIQLALGMVEHFAGTDEAASQILLRAANLVSDPLIALKYLGEIQMDQASPPDPVALAKLCQYADAHPSEGNMQLYCGALLFRRDYASGEKTGAEGILRRLQGAGRLLPANAAPHCQLGKAYRRMGRWQEALSESRTCVQMDPDSAEGHYRLAQIYQHAGQQAQSEEEMKLYEAASKKVADENARRDETIKTFLYTIRKEAPDRN